MPTRPGFHNKFEIMHYPQKIRAALYRISETFYVTRHFSPERVGNSLYYAALIRPTDESSVVLNAQRELLVVFADYETFEVRTLEAYRLFFSYVESARVDESIRFLISADNNIVRAIHLYLEQVPEYPIIVPMTFDDLSRYHDPIISAVRNNYIIRDLFGFQSPLREEHFFFGRSDVVKSVIDLAKSGQHSSLFGLRKSGKTSTIYAIERRSKPSDLTVVTFDCQDLSIHGRRYDELLIFMVNQVRARCSLKKLEQPIGLSGPEISEWFATYMQQTINSLKSNLLLIFDEIENISPNTAASDHWRSGNDPVFFWQILRSFSQSARGRAISFCIVGTSPYILEQPRINGIDNPAYLLAQKRFIPNLSFDETREMVDRLGFFMGLDFDPTAIAALQSSYGGHPFFTRQVCSKVHQLTQGNRPKKIPSVRVKQAQSEFSGQLNSYLHSIIGNLRSSYFSEYCLLRDLVNKEGTEINEYAREAPELIDHLIGYGLVKNFDGNADIAFSAISHTVKLMEPCTELKSIEDKWAELCIRRNRLEQAVRSTFLIWARSADAGDYHSIIEAQLSKKRFDALTSLEPRFLFSKDTSPLYLSDLIAILGHSSALPYLSSRRSEIRAALNAINQYRADAHAQDITDPEFEDAQRSFTMLEDEFGL